MPAAFLIRFLYLQFSALEGYFITKTLPMIKIETIEGTVFQDGVDIIKEIVKKRANLHLFENGKQSIC